MPTNDFYNLPKKKLTIEMVTKFPSLINKAITTDEIISKCINVFVILS